MQILEEKKKNRVNGLDILRFYAQTAPVYSLYSDRDERIMGLLGLQSHKKTCLLFALDLVNDKYFVPAAPVADRKVIRQYNALHRLVKQIEKVNPEDAHLFDIMISSSMLASIAIAVASNDIMETEASVDSRRTAVAEVGQKNIIRIAKLAEEIAGACGMEKLAKAIVKAENGLSDTAYQRKIINHARIGHSMTDRVIEETTSKNEITRDE